MDVTAQVDNWWDYVKQLAASAQKNMPTVAASKISTLIVQIGVVAPQID